MIPVADGMIPVAGGEIWAEDTGGGGASVVLVNPGWSTAGIWTPLLGLLAGRFRLIRYDRGVGRSPTGDDETAAAEIRAAVSAFFVIGELGQEDPPVYDRLGQVRAPAVMVRGDLEYPMVADCADAIASRIPGCGRILVPGADHLLPLRAPGRLAQIVTEHAGTAALQVFQLVDHAAHLGARGGGQGVHVGGGGAALGRGEGLLERGDVVEVEFGDPVVQVAADGPGRAAEGVAPHAREPLHQRDVGLAVVTLEELRVLRCAPQDQEPGHGRHLPSPSDR
jgi:hypothetical protein